MTIQIVSGFSPSGYLEYGRSFMNTFVRYRPKEVSVAVYVEETCDGPDRVEQRILWDIPGCQEFIEQNKNDPKATGREPVSGWRKKDEHAGYAWRFDAVRFCRQLFIPEHSVNILEDGDIFAWLDGDVVTYGEVPPGLIESQLHQNDLIYLGRRDQATELGFWALRVGPNTRAFVSDLANCCRDGSIFGMQEWHSGYVFDKFRKEYVLHDRFKAKSLTACKSNGHVWFESEIGRYTDHLKGNDRKKRGYSQERDWVSPFQPRRLLPKKDKRPSRTLEEGVDTVQYVLDNITPRRRVALDVGANKGWHTGIMSGQFDRVYAFEPDYASYTDLIARAERNVYPFNKCVMDGGGLARVAKVESGRKLSSTYYHIDPDGDIPVICIDSLGLNNCDLVKISVEGAELLVLRGARNTITKNKPVLIIERDGQGKRYGIKDWQVDNFLEATLGYERILENHPDYVWVPSGMYTCA